MANNEEIELPEDETWKAKLIRKYTLMGMIDRFYMRLSRKRKTKYLIWGVLFGVAVGVAVGILLWA